MAAQSGCVICGAAIAYERGHPNEPADRDLVVLDANDEAVVFLGPSFDGILVAPRRHVAGLIELEGRSLPSFLAALRRIASATRSNSVETLRSLPRAWGHICFGVAFGSAESVGDGRRRSA
jgi:hypothetical protein